MEGIIETRVVRDFSFFSRRNIKKFVSRNLFSYNSLLQKFRICAIINFRSIPEKQRISRQTIDTIFPLSPSLAARKIDERSSRLLDGRKSEGMTAARMKKWRRRRRKYAERRKKAKRRKKKEEGRGKRGVFLTSVLGGARNAILMKNAESTRIPAHSY